MTRWLQEEYQWVPCYRIGHYTKRKEQSDYFLDYISHVTTRVWTTLGYREKDEQTYRVCSSVNPPISPDSLPSSPMLDKVLRYDFQKQIRKWCKDNHSCSRLEDKTYIEITREPLQVIPSQLLPQGSRRPFHDGGTFFQSVLREVNTAAAFHAVKFQFQATIFYMNRGVSRPGLAWTMAGSWKLKKNVKLMFIVRTHNLLCVLTKAFPAITPCQFMDF